MTLNKTLTIALYTFKEIWKSKILLNVFFVGMGLMVVTYVATEFTFGVPERVALDFGLGLKPAEQAVQRELRLRK